MRRRKYTTNWWLSLMVSDIVMFCIKPGLYARNIRKGYFSHNDFIGMKQDRDFESFYIIHKPCTPGAVFAPLISAENLEMVTGFKNRMGVFFDLIKEYGFSIRCLRDQAN